MCGNTITVGLWIRVWCDVKYAFLFTLCWGRCTETIHAVKLIIDGTKTGILILQTAGITVAITLAITYDAWLRLHKLSTIENIVIENT